MLARSFQGLSLPSPQPHLLPLLSQLLLLLLSLLPFSYSLPLPLAHDERPSEASLPADELCMPFSGVPGIQLGLWPG